MDSVCISILNKLKAAGGGDYVILSLEELAENLTDEPVSFEDIINALSELSEQKYIDIKYSRGDMYCIRLVKEFPAEDNGVIAEVTEAAFKADDGRLYIICAALSFAGAFLGSFIVCVIFAAVG